MSEILQIVHTPHILEAIGPPANPLLKRIIAGYNDEVIHSLIFEFANGERRGLCLDDKNDPLSIMDDSNIIARVGTAWINIDHGDYIVQVEGFNSNINKFLCHSVSLQFNSGFNVSFQSRKEDCKGGNFIYTVPPDKLITNLVFLTNGTMPALGVTTTSIHLPLRKEYVSLLPVVCRHRIISLFMIFNRFLLVVEDGTYNSLPYKVSWKIVNFLCGYHLKQ